MFVENDLGVEHPGYYFAEWVTCNIILGQLGRVCNLFNSFLQRPLVDCLARSSEPNQHHIVTDSDGVPQLFNHFKLFGRVD